MQIAKKSIRQTVYDALLDCYNSTQRNVTPAQLIAVTGFNKYTIRDQLDALIQEDETVIKVSHGNFQPVTKFPETRAMSRTVLPGGLNKFEVGDDALNLTPAESRMAAVLWAGGSPGYESESVQQLQILVAQQQNALVKMQRQMGSLFTMLQKATSAQAQGRLELG